MIKHLAREMSICPVTLHTRVMAAVDADTGNETESEKVDLESDKALSIAVASHLKGRISLSYERGFKSSIMNKNSNNSVYARGVAQDDDNAGEDNENFNNHVLGAEDLEIQPEQDNSDLETSPENEAANLGLVGHTVPSGENSHIQQEVPNNDINVNNEENEPGRGNPSHQSNSHSRARLPGRQTSNTRPPVMDYGVPDDIRDFEGPEVFEFGIPFAQGSLVDQEDPLTQTQQIIVSPPAIFVPILLPTHELPPIQDPLSSDVDAALLDHRAASASVSAQTSSEQPAGTTILRPFRHDQVEGRRLEDERVVDLVLDDSQCQISSGTDAQEAEDKAQLEGADRPDLSGATCSSNMCTPDFSNTSHGHHPLTNDDTTAESLEMTSLSVEDDSHAVYVKPNMASSARPHQVVGDGVAIPTISLTNNWSGDRTNLVPPGQDIDPFQESINPLPAEHNSGNKSYTSPDSSVDSVQDGEEMLASAENDFTNLPIKDSSGPIMSQWDRTEQDADALLEQVISGKVDRNMGPTSALLSTGPCLNSDEQADISGQCVSLRRTESCQCTASKELQTNLQVVNEAQRTVCAVAMHAEEEDSEMPSLPSNTGKHYDVTIEHCSGDVSTFSLSPRAVVSRTDMQEESEISAQSSPSEHAYSSTTDTEGDMQANARDGSNESVNDGEITATRKATVEMFASSDGTLNREHYHRSGYTPVIHSPESEGFIMDIPKTEMSIVADEEQVTGKKFAVSYNNIDCEEDLNSSGRHVMPPEGTVHVAAGSEFDIISSAAEQTSDSEIISTWNTLDRERISPTNLVSLPSVSTPDDAVLPQETRTNVPGLASVAAVTFQTSRQFASCEPAVVSTEIISVNTHAHIVMSPQLPGMSTSLTHPIFHNGLTLLSPVVRNPYTSSSSTEVHIRDNEVFVPLQVHGNNEHHALHTGDHDPTEDHTLHTENHTLHTEDHTLHTEDHTSPTGDHAPTEDHSLHTEDHTLHIKDHILHTENHVPLTEDHISIPENHVTTGTIFSAPEVDFVHVKMDVKMEDDTSHNSETSLSDMKSLFHLNLSTQASKEADVVRSFDSPLSHLHISYDNSKLLHNYSIDFKSASLHSLCEDKINNESSHNLCEDKINDESSHTLCEDKINDESSQNLCEDKKDIYDESSHNLCAENRNSHDFVVVDKQDLCASLHNFCEDRKDGHGTRERTFLSCVGEETSTSPRLVCNNKEEDKSSYIIYDNKEEIKSSQICSNDEKDKASYNICINMKDDSNAFVAGAQLSSPDSWAPQPDIGMYSEVVDEDSRGEHVTTFGQVSPRQSAVVNEGNVIQPETEVAVSAELTEVAVSAELTEVAVSAELTEVAVSAELTEVAVSAELTEVAVSADLTEVAVSAEQTVSNDCVAPGPRESVIVSDKESDKEDDLFVVTRDVFSPWETDNEDKISDIDSETGEEDNEEEEEECQAQAKNSREVSVDKGNDDREENEAQHCSNSSNKRSELRVESADSSILNKESETTVEKVSAVKKISIGDVEYNTHWKDNTIIDTSKGVKQGTGNISQLLDNQENNLLVDTGIPFTDNAVTNTRIVADVNKKTSIFAEPSPDTGELWVRPCQDSVGIVSGAGSNCTWQDFDATVQETNKKCTQVDEGMQVSAKAQVSSWSCQHLAKSHASFTVIPRENMGGEDSGRAGSDGHVQDLLISNHLRTPSESGLCLPVCQFGNTGSGDVSRGKDFNSVHVVNEEATSVDTDGCGQRDSVQTWSKEEVRLEKDVDEMVVTGSMSQFSDLLSRNSDTALECASDTRQALSVSGYSVGSGTDDFQNVTDRVLATVASSSSQSVRSCRQDLCPSAKVILDATDVWLNKIKDICKSPDFLTCDPSDQQIHALAAKCKSEILAISQCPDLVDHMPSPARSCTSHSQSRYNDIRCSDKCDNQSALEPNRTDMQDNKSVPSSDSGQACTENRLSPRPPSCGRRRPANSSRHRGTRPATSVREANVSSCEVAATAASSSRPRPVSRKSDRTASDPQPYQKQVSGNTASHVNVTPAPCTSTKSHSRSAVLETGGSNKNNVAVPENNLKNSKTFSSAEKVPHKKLLDARVRSAQTSLRDNPASCTFSAAARSGAGESKRRVFGRSTDRSWNVQRNGQSPKRQCKMRSASVSKDQTLPSTSRVVSSEMLSMTARNRPVYAPMTYTGTQTENSHKMSSQIGLTSCKIGHAVERGNKDEIWRTRYFRSRTAVAHNTALSSNPKPGAAKEAATDTESSTTQSLSRLKIEPLKIKSGGRSKSYKMLTMQEFEKIQEDKHLCQAFARINSSRAYVDCHLESKYMERQGPSIKRRRERVNYNCLIALENIKFLEMLRYKKSSYDRDDQLKEFKKSYQKMMKMSKHPEQWPEQKLVDNIPGRSRIESGRCQLKSTHGQA